jgi:archaemetzincin
MFLGAVLAIAFTRSESVAAAGTRSSPAVCIQPLGKYDARYLPVVTRGIEYVYGLQVRTLEPRPLPASAWYAPRKRYRAEKILHHLDAEVVPGSGCDVVMGFTGVDISTTKNEHADWGMLGYAWIGGHSGVMSTYRLGRSARRAVLRAVKVMNHELGHALGLEHHEDCLMADLEGTVKTLDGESGLLCEESRQAIEKLRGFSMPARAAIDWSQIVRRRPPLSSLGRR